MPHDVLFHSDAFQEYAYAANEVPVFEYLEYSICREIMVLKFQLIQAPFVCILFQVLQN